MNIIDSFDKTERHILATLTTSHLAQHFYVGFSVLYPDLMIALNLNYTQLGMMTGATSIISGFLQIMWSILNRYLSRRILLGFGNILISLGCIIMGNATRFLEIISGNIVSGSGQAAQHPVGTSIITYKFPRMKVSHALSIHYGMGYIGNIISPILLSYIAISLDWRYATYFLAAIPFTTGLLVLYNLRGIKAAEKSLSNNDRGNIWNDIRSTIYSKNILVIILAQAFAVGGTGMGVIITYTPLFLRNVLHLESFETSVIYSIAVIGGVLGTIFFGHLGSKFGELKIAAAILGVCSSLIFLLIAYNSFTIIIILHLFIIGSTSFACSSLLQAYLATISTHRQRDIVIGLYFTIGFGISSIWTTLTGFLIDAYNSFTPAWMLRALLGTVAFFFIIYALHQKYSAR